MTKIMKGGREYGSTPASASGVAYSNLVSGLVATNVQDAIDESYGKVTQTASTINSAYEVLFSGTADNTTRTENTRKSSGFTYNPSTSSISLTGDATVSGKVISPHKSVSYINKDQVCGLLAQKDYNTSAWYPAVCLDTYGGGHWQVGNYNSETLQFVYGTKTNKDANTNKTQQFSLKPYNDNDNHTANIIIGSGTSDCIAKFNADNSVTAGPAFGTSTTKFLRNDGTFSTLGLNTLSNVTISSASNGQFLTYSNGTWVNTNTISLAGGINVNGSVIVKNSNNQQRATMSISSDNGTVFVTNTNNKSVAYLEIDSNNGGRLSLLNNSTTRTVSITGSDGNVSASKFNGLALSSGSATAVRCTILNGGYITLGSYVFLDICFTLTSAVNNSASIVSGLPTPKYNSNISIVGTVLGDAQESTYGFRVVSGSLYANGNRSNGGGWHVFGSYVKA